MSNLIALVTGANKGIGFETAIQLAKKNIKVIATTRSPDNIPQMKKKFDELKLPIDVLKLDMNQTDDFKTIYNYISDKFQKLDILINNAGVILEKDFSGNTSATVSPKILKDTFNTNFFSVVELTQTLLPLIKKSAAGRIVNLSSILGSLTLHADSNSPISGSKPLGYNASKTALNAFTIHLADALKDTKIKVNSAHPGWVKTDMGGDIAPMDVALGAKTSVDLALLDDSGPTGKYIHLGDQLPW